jgi:hypothetical protein
VAEPKPSLEVAINRSWLFVSWEVVHDFQPFYRRLYTVFLGDRNVAFWRHVVVRDEHCRDVGVCECHWDAVSADRIAVYIAMLAKFITFSAAGNRPAGPKAKCLIGVF